MINLNLHNANILIVDDKQSNIDILEDILEMSGFKNIKSVTDSRLAVGLFESFKPDLLLLDLMMPHLNGFEVMDQLRTLIPEKTYFPILVLTADITPKTKIRALSNGAKDFLSKPFDVNEVELRINNLLETRSLYLQLEGQNQILEEKVKERTYDLEQANTTLDKANKELEVLDKAKSDFLRLISHEIRTPINGIFGFTGILKYEIKSPELLEYIDGIEESGKRLEAFSYQALLITELLTKRHKIKPEIASIHKLIFITKTQLEDKIKAKGITIILENEQTIDELRGDLELLQTCFDQLIDNSVKFSANNGIVTVKVYSENQSIICEFIDNGSGFPTKILNKPFHIFGVDQHIDENTGLNLALIKLIMDFHQGHIKIYNNQSNGATVKLIFNNQR